MKTLSACVKQRFSKVLSAILILFVMFLLFYCNGRTISKDQVNLKEEWAVSINGEQFHNVVLEDFQFDVTQIGDVLTLSHELPDVGEDACVRFWICHCAIDAYVDDELVYTYGHERVEHYRAVGSGFYFIELPKDYVGKTLTIRLTVGEFDAFSCFDPIYIEPSGTVIISFLSSKLVPLLGGVFLLVIGAVGMCLCSFVVVEIYKIKQLMYIFQFALCVGLWTLCNNGIAQLIIGDYVICQTLEFLSIFLAPIPLLLFLQEDDEKDELLHKIATVFICFIQLVCAVAVVTIGVGLLHFQHFLSLFHVIMLVTVALIVVMVSRRIRNGNREKVYVLVGCIMLALGCVIDVSAFYLKKYLNLYNRDIDFLTVIGAVCMVMCLFVSFFASVRERIEISAEHEVLEKLAYHDILTGAINRVRYEEQLDECDENGEPYAIMYFDLNGLKSINDTCGHARGDCLIKDFSLCLQIVFQGMGDVARLGGDEFAIILPKAGKEEIVAAVKRMQDYIRQHNEEADTKLETAFGVAFSVEAADRQARTVNKLADSRMYEMKKKMKNARV